MHLPLTASELDWLVQNYPLIGRQAAAKHLGCSAKTVDAHARKLRLFITPETRLRLVTEGRRKGPEAQKVDPRLFMENMTPEGAYLLGLIWADGNLDKTHNTILIPLVEATANAVWPTFLKTGKWNRYYRRRYNPTWQDTWVTNTSNYILHPHLKAHGYLAKSWASACSILSTVPAHLKHYWFRGLMDGDGSFMISKGKHSGHKRRASIASGYDQDWTYLTSQLDTLGIPYRVERTQRINRASKRINAYSKVHLEQMDAVIRWGEYLYEGWDTDCIGLPVKHDIWYAVKAHNATRKAPPRFKYICVTNRVNRSGSITPTWKVSYGTKHICWTTHGEEDAKAKQDAYALAQGLPVLGERWHTHHVIDASGRRSS